MTTSVRLWALPTKASPNPRRAGSTSRGTSESAAGRMAAMPIPWKIRPRGTEPTVRPARRPGATGSRSRPCRPAPRREPAHATDPIDDDARDERGRDLDQCRGPDDQSDLWIRYPGARQRDRQRRRERVEAGLHGEEGDGESEHPSIIGQRDLVQVDAGPGGPGPGGSAGRRGRPCLAGRRARTTLAGGAHPARIPR